MSERKAGSRFIAMIVAFAMVITMMPQMAFAAGNAAAKHYTAKITMLHETKNQPSMCDSMFDENADITVENGIAKVKILVANPVPGFADQGADGTVKNVKVSYDKSEYTAVSQLGTDEKMTAKADNVLFGFEKGKKYPAQVLTVSLPEKAITEGALLKTDAYVNVVMMTDVVFRMSITDLKEIIPMADYSRVDEALAKIPADLDKYTPDSVAAVNEAKEAVVRELNASKQADVDKMAADIENAVAALVKIEYLNEGKYKAAVAMKHEYKDQNSMCDPMFGADADIEIRGNNAVIKMLVANPVPAFADQGADGTVKNFKVTYNGKQYTAESELGTEAKMTAKADNALFGLEKGKKYPAQVLTVTLPKEAVYEGALLKTDAYVNVVMNTDVIFRMAVTDVEKVVEKEEISDFSFSKYFSRVNDTTYKYRSRGKHVNANPVVKDAKGNTLVKDTDYKVIYSDGERVVPGEYTVTVRGMGDYTGTVEKTLVITPEAVDGVKVRQTTATGGYDDAYVTWADSEGADGYQVYTRRPSKTEEWTYLGRTTKTSFLEKDLYDGYKYEFKVIPYVNADGTRFRTTDNYDTVSMYTMKKVSRPSVKKYSSSRVKISWNNISGESGYQVMASRSGKTTYFRTSDTSMRISVAKNKKYTYKVRAYKNVTKNGETYRVYAPWSDARTYTLK